MSFEKEHLKIITLIKIKSIPFFINILLAMIKNVVKINIVKNVIFQRIEYFVLFTVKKNHCTMFSMHINIYYIVT